MEIFGIISIIILVAIAFYVAGLFSMSMHIHTNARKKQSGTVPNIPRVPPIPGRKPPEKQPTRNSIYADHVIHTAALIYCNYNESKIIRVGQEKQKTDRYAQALTESFNLVNKAYGVFDSLDKDEKEAVN